MAIHVPGVGDVVRATDVNQYGDFPSTPVTAFVATAQAITSSTYANLPTTSATASLVLTHASTRVQVTVSGLWGSGALGTPTGDGALSVALSGALTQAASDQYSVHGESPGQTVGASSTYVVVVPAGALTATAQAKFLHGTGINVQNVTVQLTALGIA